MTLREKMRILKYPLEAALFTTLMFLIVLNFYLREEHETHTTYVDAARKEKVQRITAEYNQLLALLRNFVFYNGDETIKAVTAGRSLASLNLTFFVRENPVIHNLLLYDEEYKLLRQLKREDEVADAVARRLRELKFIEGLVFENNDDMQKGDAAHRVYFPVDDAGYIVFVLNNTLLINGVQDPIFDVTFYNDGFHHLAGTNIRTPGKPADNRLSQLLTGKSEGVYTLNGEELSFGHILLINGIIYTTVYALDISRSHLIYYTIVVLLLLMPMAVLLCRGLLYTVETKVLHREIIFEYDDPVIKRLDKSLRDNIANADRMLDTHLDIQVMKEELIDCREQLAQRRRRAPDNP